MQEWSLAKQEGGYCEVSISSVVLILISHVLGLIATEEMQSRVRDSFSERCGDIDPPF